jgi:hypothetical protein
VLRRPVRTAMTPAMLMLTSKSVPGALIFARDGGCVQNCPEELPVCDCLPTERCELTAQNCVECAQVKCRKVAKSKSGVSGGAIAGACVGGLVVVGILGFFVWRSRAKKQIYRRSMAATAAEKENDFGMLKSARVRTPRHEVCASTVEANTATGINTYGRFNRFHGPYASLQCYSNRIHPWCYESLESFYSRSSSTTGTPSSLLGLARRFPVSSVAEHRHTVCG